IVQAGFNNLDLLFCPQDLLFIFFKLLGNIPLSINKCLLPEPVLRNLIFMSVSNLEIITDNIIESNPNGRYTRRLSFSPFYLIEMMFPFEFYFSQLIKLLIYTSFQNIPISKRHRRIRVQHFLIAYTDQLSALHLLTYGIQCIMIRYST